jgi:hypothetical protein
VRVLIDEVDAQKALLSTSREQWLQRIKAVDSVDALLSALRDLETELNVLGDGLPKGACDIWH